MTHLYIVDFKNKKLISKRDLDTELPHPDQTCIEKYTYFCKLIEESMTSVKVNAAYDGISLPAHMKKEPVAVINWSKKFKLNDFAYDDDGVRGTLSFSGRPHFTNLPWRAVWGISHSDGSKAKEWGEDFPNEIVVPGE